MPNNHDTLIEYNLVEPPREPTLEEQYPGLEFYRGVPVFRIGDEVYLQGYGNFFVVTRIYYSVIDDWLREGNTPRSIEENIYYTEIEGPWDDDTEDGESYTDSVILDALLLKAPFKPKEKSGLVKFLEKHT